MVALLTQGGCRNRPRASPGAPAPTQDPPLQRKRGQNPSTLVLYPESIKGPTALPTGHRTVGVLCLVHQTFSNLVLTPNTPIHHSKIVRILSEF